MANRETRSQLFARWHKQLNRYGGPEIKTVRQKIDWCIRMAAVGILFIFGNSFVVIAAVFAAILGNLPMLLFAICVFVVGTAIVFGLCCLASSPHYAEPWIPGPRIIGKTLVRLPAYLIVFAALSILMLKLCIGR